MSKSDITRNPVLNGSRVYVIRARRADRPHKHDDMPWYLAAASAATKDPVYTTESKDAQGFSSLVSADLYVIALNQDFPEYVHAVDVLSRS